MGLVLVTEPISLSNAEHDFRGETRFAAVVAGPERRIRLQSVETSISTEGTQRSTQIKFFDLHDHDLTESEHEPGDCCLLVAVVRGGDVDVTRLPGDDHRILASLIQGQWREEFQQLIFHDCGVGGDVDQELPGDVHGLVAEVVQRREVEEPRGVEFMQLTRTQLA